MQKTTVIIEVQGLAGKFAEHATFAVQLPFVPAAGDELELPNHPMHDVIRCTVLRRRISETQLLVIAKYDGNR